MIYDTFFINAKSESVSVFDSPTLKIIFWKIKVTVNMVMMITITMMMRLFIMRMTRMMRMLIMRKMGMTRMRRILTVSNLEVGVCD